MRPRALNYEEYVLLVIFTMMSIILVCFINYFAATIYIEQVSNSFYSSNAIFFKVAGEPLQDGVSIMYEAMQDVVLYKELDSYNDQRAILIKSLEQDPDMREGRYFDESDFFIHKKLAVIGKYADSLIEELNGCEVIYVAGQPYEVIGRIGDKYESKLDRLVVFNLDSMEMPLAGVYALDGDSASAVTASYKAITESLGSVGVLCEKINRENGGVSRLSPHQLPNIVLMVSLLLILILSTLAFSLSWFEKKKSELAIQRLVGFSFNMMAWDIGKRYLMLANTGFIIGFIGSYSIILATGTRYVINEFIMLSYGLLLVCGALAVAPLLIKTRGIRVRVLLSE